MGSLGYPRSIKGSALAELAHPLLSDHSIDERDASPTLSGARNLYQPASTSAPVHPLVSPKHLGSCSPFSPDGLPVELEGSWREGMDLRVITTPAPPFSILEASPEWLRFCGFRIDEVKGKSLAILQGERTERLAVQKLMSSVSDGEGTEAIIINYTKHLIAFENHVRIEPMHDRTGLLRGFLAITTRATRVAPVERSVAELWVQHTRGAGSLPATRPVRHVSEMEALKREHTNHSLYQEAYDLIPLLRAMADNEQAQPAREQMQAAHDASPGIHTRLQSPSDGPIREGARSFHRTSSPIWIANGNRAAGAGIGVDPAARAVPPGSEREVAEMATVLDSAYQGVRRSPKGIEKRLYSLEGQAHLLQPAGQASCLQLRSSCESTGTHGYESCSAGGTATDELPEESIASVPEESIASVPEGAAEMGTAPTGTSTPTGFRRTQMRAPFVLPTAIGRYRGKVEGV